MLSRFLRFLTGRDRVIPHSAPPVDAETTKLWALDLLTGNKDGPADNGQPVGPSSAAGPEAVRLLKIVNREGSVEHYFHFILGFLAPLLLWPKLAERRTRTLVRSCGPMSRLLEELAIEGVEVLPKAEWHKLRQANTHGVEQVWGFDAPEFYDAAAFAAFRLIMLEQCGLAGVAGGSGLLIVDRGEPSEAYEDEGVENPTSANIRRSVPNMAAIRDELRAGGHACTMVRLETITLREQVRLFLGTRTLVAQHGAALVNMVWMASGGQIVEIRPNVGKFTLFFERLAEVCGHSYVAVRQDTSHAPVNVEAVLHAIGE